MATDSNRKDYCNFSVSMALQAENFKPPVVGKHLGISKPLCGLPRKCNSMQILLTEWWQFRKG